MSAVTREQENRVLRDVLEWLSDREHWCQGAMFQPLRGGIQRAEQTCVLGAVRKATPRQIALRDAVEDRLHNTAWRKYLQTTFMVNDTLGYDAVMAMVRGALEAE